eukprot:72605-Prymnesium_polylepis.1
MVASRNGREGLGLNASHHGGRILASARLETRRGRPSICGFRLEMRSGVSKWGGGVRSHEQPFVAFQFLRGGPSAEA